MGKIQIENKMVQNVLPICLTFHRKIQEKKTEKEECPEENHVYKHGIHTNKYTWYTLFWGR